MKRSVFVIVVDGEILVAHFSRDYCEAWVQAWNSVMPIKAEFREQKFG